jgi:hypothetical protein
MLLTATLMACGTASGPDCPDAPPASFPAHPHDDRELEARLPESLGGVPISPISYCASRSREGDGIPTSSDFLDAVGVDLTNVTVLRGMPPAIGATRDHTDVAAWRYRGVDEDRLRDTYIAMTVEGYESADIDSTFTETEMGGKTVHEHSVDGVILYVADDTMYLISGANCEELVAALP